MRSSDFFKVVFCDWNSPFAWLIPRDVLSFFDCFTFLFLCLRLPDSYRYQWSLFAHPAGTETGEMIDLNSASLKLSSVSLSKAEKILNTISQSTNSVWTLRTFRR